MSQDIFNAEWDVIVIGTGIGGGTIGRVLAEGNMRVLFIEKGPQGHRSETQPLDMEMFVPEARRVRGYWPTPIRAKIDGTELSHYAPLGAGVGGSSVFYAATLERPERHDLDHSEERPHPTGGWPVDFAEMAPWYDQAAAMYHICGDPDPLSPEPAPTLLPPPPMSAGDSALLQGLSAQGLHPYRLHSAIRYLPKCQDCLGRKCPRPCKMDGRSAGVEPALSTGKAAILTNAEVTRIQSDNGKATGLEVVVDGETHEFSAPKIVLAGGALGSAHLMLASANPEFPDGLANSSGLVGRNLMFHLNEMFALWPGKNVPNDGPSKAISMRDLYYQNGTRFGTVQAMGIDASYGEILHFLRMTLARSLLRRVPLINEFARIPALIAERIMGHAKIFVGLLEDIGYPDNRVRFDPDTPDQICIDYTLGPELRKRRKQFRKSIRKAFRGYRRMFLSMQPELNFGHPCGTMRFGDDPMTSVLDRNCKAHDLDNLYIVDASFMPTSFGVNPSLTIAANAMRVGAHILKEAKA